MGGIDGRRTLVVGLAWRNVRHRPWQALLLLLALSVATTTITLALALVDVGDRAWERVSQATNGFHVEAGAEISPDMSPAQLERVRAELARLGAAPGVVAAGGPWPAQGRRRDRRRPLGLGVQVRDPGPAAVDQPLVTAGHWLDEREGVVLEDGFAAAASLQPGDIITIAGQRVPVRGRGVDGRRGPVPDGSAGQGVDQPGHRRPARHGPRPRRVCLDICGWRTPTRPSRSPPPTRRSTTPGRRPRGRSRSRTIEELAAVFGILAIFVVVLTIGTAVILVAGRMAAQIRQVGTLKAVGVTPGQVTCVLLVEYLAVAVLATAVGLAVGSLLAPSLARVTDVLAVYGAQAPPITWPRAAASCRHHRRRGPGHGAARAARRAAQHPALPRTATPGHPTGPAG